MLRTRAALPWTLFSQGHPWRRPPVTALVALRTALPRAGRAWTPGAADQGPGFILSLEKGRPDGRAGRSAAWMVSPAVTVLQAGIQLGSAVLYLWVARIVLSRPVEGDARTANVLFATWWSALASAFILAPLLTVPPRLFGYEDLAFATALLNGLLMLIVVAVWGLVYYLVYLYSGNPRWFWPVAAFYAVVGFTLLYWVALLDPSGFDDAGTLTYSRGQLSGAPAIGLLFSVPVVVAALAYGSLFFRVRQGIAKYRIGMVAGGFLLQFGWSVVSTSLGLSRRYPDSVTLSLVSSSLGILAATAVLLAFRPPAAVRARFGMAEPGGG